MFAALHGRFFGLWGGQRMGAKRMEAPAHGGASAWGRQRMEVKTPVLTALHGSHGLYFVLRFIIFALICQDWSLDLHALSLPCAVAPMRCRLIIFALICQDWSLDLHALSPPCAVAPMRCRFIIFALICQDWSLDPHALSPPCAVAPMRFAPMRFYFKFIIKKNATISLISLA